MKVLVGDPIPLVVRVRDRNDSLIVTATLLSSMGEKIGSTMLDNRGGGVYVGSYPMPDLPVVFPRYDTSEPGIYGGELGQPIERESIAEKAAPIAEIIGDEPFGDIAEGVVYVEQN